MDCPLSPRPLAPSMTFTRSSTSLRAKKKHSSSTRLGQDNRSDSWRGQRGREGCVSLPPFTTRSRTAATTRRESRGGRRDGEMEREHTKIKRTDEYAPLPFQPATPHTKQKEPRQTRRSHLSCSMALRTTSPAHSLAQKRHHDEFVEETTPCGESKAGGKGKKATRTSQTPRSVFISHV